MQCPKCSYIRIATDHALSGICPRCGIVYAKYCVPNSQPPPIPLENDYRFWGTAVAVIFLLVIFYSISKKTETPEPAPIARVVAPAPKPMAEAEILEKIVNIEELSGIGVEEFREMRRLYSMLAQSNKSIKMYQQKVIELDAQIAKMDAEDAAEDAVYAAKQQALKDREASIKKQFSGWDGSHILFTPMIKSMMKNPDSYEHVETRWWTQKDYIYVETTYRGTNSFGAIVPTISGARFTIRWKVFRVRSRLMMLATLLAKVAARSRASC